MAKAKSEKESFNPKPDLKTSRRKYLKYAGTAVVGGVVGYAGGWALGPRPILGLYGVFSALQGPQAPKPSREGVLKEIELPTPRYDSDVSIEQALLKRRSVRSYLDKPLTLQELSQLLWSAQGITNPRGFRTAPSAIALYPLELHAVVGDVEGLEGGVYRYQPDGHKILKTADGDRRAELVGATVLWQECVREGAVDLVITAVYERTTRVAGGDRGVQYVHLEGGHAAQNVCLQATALGLGTVTIGGIYEDRIREVLNLPENENPLYIMPIGFREQS